MKKIILLCCWLSTGIMFAQEAARIIIDTEGDVHPWNMLDVNNDPSTFQFAIVTDRTGGLRPGIFPVAVEKLNLLQPEFVMSVGDLISGYTEDEDRIDREWDEFTGFIEKLEMPFFYVPGNHDFINDVMEKKWKERFGKDYYHFTYKDVLFLCLNTEEEKRGSRRGYIAKPQYDYIKKTLEENQEVKWTLIFMHQPLWDQEADNGMWEEIEELLKGRKHTVYVGHRHRYVKYERNDSKYFILATTGGGSGLRGPAFGEFDHVVWITMTDDGPIMANLLLDGIWDENVQTEGGRKRTQELTETNLMEVLPPLAKEGKFDGGDLVFKFNNPANIPLEVEVEVDAHPQLFVASAPQELEIEPNSVEEIKIPIKAEQAFDLKELDKIEVEIDYSYEEEGRPEITWEKDLKVMPLQMSDVAFSGKPFTIDGSLSEWPSLRQEVKDPVVQSDPFSHKGDKDASFSFDVAYHQEFLYLAINVKDDELIFEEKGDVSSQDAAFFQVDARPLEKIMNGEVGWRFRDWLAIGIAPNEDGSVKLLRQQYMPEGYKIACKLNKKGYSIEVAIPMKYITDLQGDTWKHLRINAGIHDMDKKGEHESTLFWQADWRGEDNVLGSGLFEKK